MLKCVLETRIREEWLKMAQNHVHFWGFVLAGFRPNITGSADRLNIHLHEESVWPTVTGCAVKCDVSVGIYINRVSK